MPARSRLPHGDVVPPRATPYTPIQVLFLARLAHLVALCYRAHHQPDDTDQDALLRHALRSTLDDCFEAGLAPELLAILAEELAEA